MAAGPTAPFTSTAPCPFPSPTYRASSHDTSSPPPPAIHRVRKKTQSTIQNSKPACLQPRSPYIQLAPRDPFFCLYTTCVVTCCARPPCPSGSRESGRTGQRGEALPDTSHKTRSLWECLYRPSHAPQPHPQPEPRGKRETSSPALSQEATARAAEGDVQYYTRTIEREDLTRRNVRLRTGRGDRLPLRVSPLSMSGMRHVRELP